MSGVEGEEVLARLLAQGHRLDPARLPAALEGYYSALGINRLAIYLADVQQDVLLPFTCDGVDLPGLRIDASMAGWAYRTTSTRVADDPDGTITAWIPLIDGIERIGVLEIGTPALDASTLRCCRSLASLLALLLVSKSTWSDAYACGRRAKPMRLPAEMVWAFLPPRTIGSPQVTSTAVLEPAYDLGGDAFDHSLADGALHTAIVDAMGHDLTAGLTSAVTIAACRNARRGGADLPEIVATVDGQLHQVFPQNYVTGIFARLELTTGTLRWANCGHPAPLLLRGNDLVPAALDRAAALPLGLGPELADAGWPVHEAQLRPGDRVLLYTDGVTDARSDTGERFGQERFTDFIIRAVAAGETAPEVLRRLIRAILEHQHGRLTDDASIVMFEWHPTGSDPQFRA
ncbi:PP2C family protein-serine/threonine phosphatase [Frankia sp. QA3]|uniref:PP2C family protein-serine/threonine phosphatase n=1 Tax=Frankia sp. QA3 TaxID=710111 RepID=UPI00055A1AFC|nr:PP2C family protein-serine/threonine phosphatase [Frankia sp. QA3]